MIFVGERRAEQRHDAVAHHLIDGTFVTVDRVHHMLEDRIKQFASLLRITIRQQLHRPLHVSEQHRDLLALAFERTLGSQNLFGEVLWACRQ